MKRLIVIMCAIAILSAVNAQAKYAVPSLTDLQKYQIAAMYWNGSYMLQISYARAMGKTVEDVAKFVGDKLKDSWKQGGGFDGFVRQLLYTTVIMVSNGSVEITEQTDNCLVYRVNGLYSDLKEGGTIYNVTYDDYLKFWEIVFSRLADNYNVKYSQKDTDEGLIVSVSKK